MNRSTMSVFLIAFIFLFAFYADGYGAQAHWWEFSRDEAQISYCDNGQIKKVSRGVFQAWTKTKLLKKGAVGALGEKFRDVDVVLELWEINCPERKTRLMKAVFYSPAGKIVGSINKSGIWRDVPPESRNERLFGIVCK